MRRLAAFLVSVGLIFAAGQSLGQMTTTGAGKKPGGGGCPGGVVTLDPANTGASTAIVLSGCNLIATGGASPSNASNSRSTTSHNAGPTVYYVEATMGTGTSANGSSALGIVNASFTIGDNGVGKWMGATANSTGYYDDGNVYISGSAAKVLPAWTGGSALIGMCLDISNSRLGFRLNGGNWNNNVANTCTTNGADISGIIAANSTLFVGVQAGNTGASVTVNFLPTAPGGMSVW